MEETKTINDLFRFWIEQGWRYRRRHNQRMKTHAAEYKSRLAHEVKMIEEKDFVNYFLMVSDLVRYAKDSGIAVGPGRGSSAASLVCYLLRITEIDPMQYPMLFERFLDPTRLDEPDIDIDFEDDRRGEVFTYAASKYGESKVSNIGTFTRYKGRNSLDDIARVYHIPSWKIEAIKGKLLERAEGHPRSSKTLVDTYDSFSDINELVSQTPELNYAARLEGNLRGFGVHAAGMVISAIPLDNICATYQREIAGRKGSSIAFDKYDAAYLGLLKIDALSLQTMGMIAKVVELAGISLEELYRVPLDEPNVMEAFRAGDVLGIFQFEGLTTRRILRKVKPTTFQHLSDVNALARPGADDKTYVWNKNNFGDKNIQMEFLHSIMQQHLSWTYGVVVYEEQILMILRDLGGFEPAELNRMRKIIHDKLGSTAFNEYFNRFIKGAAAHGLSETTAESIWNGMVSASGYAFNIAHSVCYAHIGYWQMWLKINYPAEFYTGQLLKCSDDVRRGKIIQEAQRRGIDVDPPSLLDSQQDWTLVEDLERTDDFIKGRKRIVAGLTAVAGIGPKTAENIISWREQKTTEFGIDDFFPEWSDLIEVKGIGSKTISTIVKFCESSDPFGINEMNRILDKIRSNFAKDMISGIMAPTHISIDIPVDREMVSYIGILRRVKFYDAVEQLQKRITGEELSYEEALERLEDPHLLKYVALDVEDEYGETVKVRVSRWVYPKFRELIQGLKINRDVIVAQGFSSDFGGISIQIKNMIAINPYQH